MEITAEADFTIEEKTLLDMHSVVNVVNIILYELSSLSEHLGTFEPLDSLQHEIVDMADNLRDPEMASRQVQQVNTHIRRIETVLQPVWDRAETPQPDGSPGDPFVLNVRQNLQSIYQILKIRAREIMARHQNPDAWVVHEICALRTNFSEVFRAIERNSHGSYRIVYNVAEHEKGDYFVTLDITSDNGKTVCMPAIFQDVMRDILANARKYTEPGGHITAGLYDSGEELRFVVEDEGRGIPQDEIDGIVEFGSRGSNVQDRPTRGGGFGLTKAYYVTRKFGGRMWIDSELGQGTRIEIRIPHPNPGQSDSCC